MNKDLETLKLLKDSVLRYTKNGLDRRFIIGSCDVLEKKLKVLEIIKEKKVDLEYLKCCETYEQYKAICSYWNEITQEEYELLKEVLK